MSRCRPRDPGRPGRRGEQGFTLVEVIAAMAILAAVLTVAYRLQADGLGGLARGAGRAEALALAEAQLAALGTERVLQAGRFGGEANGRSWEVTVEPRGDGLFAGAPARGLAAWRVTVTVRGPDGGVRLATTRLAAAP